MAFELHVWGPAFSLPSIDPQCLAAVAYLSSLAKQLDEDLQWHVIVSNDPNATFTKELPFLIYDSSCTISGLENIIDFLNDHISSSSRNTSATALQEEEPPSQQQQQQHQHADLTAFTSHILHHAPALLSLSLFASTENYTTVTRPAYSALLPWPLAYIVPPNLRSRAQAQTAHLGFTSPDLADDISDGSDVAARRRNGSIIPESLRTLGGSRGGGTQAKTSVTGILTQQPQMGSARFRLDALVDDFCAPLNGLLLGSEEQEKMELGMEAKMRSEKGKDGQKKKRYLLHSSFPSSLDCVATGYLSLMLHPILPQDWLASRIRQRWPGLAAYTLRMGEELWDGQRSTDTLPWRATPPPPLPLVSLAGTLSSAAIAGWTGIPGFGGGNTIVHPLPSQGAGAEAGASPNQSRSQQQQQPHTLPTILMTATATAVGVAAASSYLVLPYLSSPPAAAPVEERKQNLSEMGEAGALLSSGVEFGSFAG